MAILFNLIQRPIPTRIQIVKNLRVCGDCRKFKNYSIYLNRILFILDLVTKMIAQMYQCLIIVRDANRIHHFYPNGKCSCQDQF